MDDFTIDRSCPFWIELFFDYALIIGAFGYCTFRECWSFSCRSISRKDLIEYISTHYKGPRMVLAAAGGQF